MSPPASDDRSGWPVRDVFHAPFSQSPLKSRMNVSLLIKDVRARPNLRLLAAPRGGKFPLGWRKIPSLQPPGLSPDAEPRGSSPQSCCWRDVRCDFHEREGSAGGSRVTGACRSAAGNHPTGDAGWLKGCLLCCCLLSSRRRWAVWTGAHVTAQLITRTPCAAAPAGVFPVVGPQSSGASSSGRVPPVGMSEPPHQTLVGQGAEPITR